MLDATPLPSAGQSDYDGILRGAALRQSPLVLALGYVR